MSSFGQAALNLSVNAGAEVIATTRKGHSFHKLQPLGAKRVEIEGPELSSHIGERKRIDAVFDLVGNSTILDSLSDASPRWPRMLGGLSRRSGSGPGLQPFTPDVERRSLQLLRQLRFWHTWLSII